MTSYYGQDYPDPVDPDEIGSPESDVPALDARLIDGAAFVLDAPAEVPAVWGKGQDVLWSAGEALMLVGPQGVGKTTLAQQLALARTGLRSEVLGWPIEPGKARTLYLAMDRPRQASRSMRRMVGERDRRILAERLAVWQGPPPYDLAKHPGVLTSMCHSASADTVILDSLKDAAIGLTDDEVGAAYNRARQLAIAAGIEVIELHHQVKRGSNNGQPNTLADVYGSVWLTSGTGSVLLLWGQAGDPIVELKHLKQPAAEVGPVRVIHDHDRGATTVWHVLDLLDMALHAVGGVTAKAAASALFGTDKPEPAQVEKARRKLDALAAAGHLERVDGDRAKQLPAVYLSAERMTPGGAP